MALLAIIACSGLTTMTHADFFHEEMLVERDRLEAMHASLMLSPEGQVHLVNARKWCPMEDKDGHSDHWKILVDLP